MLSGKAGGAQPTHSVVEGLRLSRQANEPWDRYELRSMQEFDFVQKPSSEPDRRFPSACAEPALVWDSTLRTAQGVRITRDRKPTLVDIGGGSQKATIGTRLNRPMH